MAKLPYWMVSEDTWRDRPIHMGIDNLIEESMALAAKKTTNALDYLERIRDTLILNNIKNEPAEEIINKILNQKSPTEEEKVYLQDFIEFYMKKESGLKFNIGDGHE